VVSAFNDSHVAQMTGYLSHTGLRLGLLMNFKHAKLQWKRVVNGSQTSVLLSVSFLSSEQDFIRVISVIRGSFSLVAATQHHAIRTTIRRFVVLLARFHAASSEICSTVAFPARIKAEATRCPLVVVT